MDINVKDILLVQEDKKPHFWGDFFKGHYNAYLGHRNSRAITRAQYMVTYMMELAMNDILNEGTEICFKDSQKNPYMIWFVKDFRYVALKYKYKAKFRGHMNRFFVYTYPSFCKRAKLRFIKPTMQFLLYLRLSKLVQKGMDYPDMPDFAVYRKMRQPYADRK